MAKLRITQIEIEDANDSVIQAALVGISSRVVLPAPAGAPALLPAPARVVHRGRLPKERPALPPLAPVEHPRRGYKKSQESLYVFPSTSANSTTGSEPVPATDLRAKRKASIPQPSLSPSRAVRAAAAAENFPAVEVGSSKEQILAALKKKPMSSGELIEFTKLPNSVIYQTCSILKGQGALESKPDPVDETRRWYLTHLA